MITETHEHEEISSFMDRERYGYAEYYMPPEADKDLTDPVFALLIGHTDKQAGAKSYLDIYENPFNLAVAREVQKQLHGEVTVINYLRTNTDIKKSVEEFAKHMVKSKVKGCIVLHFNSFEKDGVPTVVLGSETLIIDNPDNCSMALDLMSRLRSYSLIWSRGIKFINKEYDKERGDCELIPLNENGIPSCIIEPCFGNTENFHSKIIFEETDKYHRVLIDSITKFCFRK